MVDLLVILEVVLIEHIVDDLSFHPEDVPVIPLDLLVPLPLQGVHYAVLERSFELDLRAKGEAGLSY